MAIKRLLKKLLKVKCVKIIGLVFCEKKQELRVHLESTQGQKSRCPICNRKCPGYDKTTTKKKWRSLDFGTYKVYLVADVNRVNCKKHGVLTEKTSWAHHHSNYTKEFELQVSYLALHVNKSEVSKIMRISWHTVGPILSRAKDRLEPDSRVRYQNLRRIGIDETSYKKGHKYVTVVIDHDTNQIIWVGKDIGKAVLEDFMMDLSEEQRQNIKLVSADGAKWIKTCIDQWLPQAEFCIDGFHVVGWALEAMDSYRKGFWREEMKKVKKDQRKREVGRPRKGEVVVKNLSAKELKKAKYPLGKNPENLTKYQASCLDEIRYKYPKLFKGYQLKEGLRLVFQCNVDTVESELKLWLSWASRSRIPEFVDLSRKIRRHYDSIINTVQHRLSNARLEAMNNKIKVLIRKAYGFRNTDNLIDMIMISCSNLAKEIKPAYEYNYIPL